MLDTWDSTTGTSGGDQAWDGGEYDSMTPQANLHVCYKCHSTSVYVSGGATGRFDHDEDANHTLGDIASPLGIVCFNCHGGYSSRPEGGLGAIHGTNETYIPGAESTDGDVSTTPTKRYRFMSGGANRYYKPTPQTDTTIGDAEWERAFVDIDGMGGFDDFGSCYTVAAADDWSTNGATTCAQHGDGVDSSQGGGDGSGSLNYQKPLEY